MSIKRAIQTAKDLLSTHSVHQIPIPIEKISRDEGLSIVLHDFKENVSGALIYIKDKVTIGVNPTESTQRKRFTIAHELGHYKLHATSKKSIFVDEKSMLWSEMHFRNEATSTGLLKKEREANAFAAELLMPKEMLQEQINDYFESNEHHSDEHLIKTMAKKFNVSEIAMTYRLGNLNLAIQ